MMGLSPAMPQASARQDVAGAARPKHNFYLWCMLALVITFLVEMMGTVAFVHLVLPAGLNHSSTHLALNVASAVFALVTLFGMCVSEHLRRNDRAQRELLRKLEHESATGCRVIDQDTNTFTAEYFQQALLREMGHASVSAKAFCVAKCVLATVGTGAQKEAVCGYLEHALAQILRNGLRASDVIAHTGAGEFTVILPELNERLAQVPLDRIRRAAERWNRNSSLQYRMRIRLGMCEYDRNSTLQELLLRVSQRCHLDQHFSYEPSHPSAPSGLLSHDFAEQTRHVC